jgi:replicative DNA helicase
VLAELTSPRFHDLIGSILKPEFFPTKAAQHLIMAAHGVALGGNACSSPTLAMQHLMTLHDAGKMKIEEIDAAREYIDSCEEFTFGDLDAVIRTLTPVVQKVETKNIVAETLLKVGKDQTPLDDIAGDFQRVADIGKKKMTMGIGLVATESAIESVLDRRLVDPLPTGIEELDMHLGGGLEKKALACVVAPSSAGKSFFLCHVSVQALIEGHNVAYLSLELSEEQVLERIIANLTDMTIEEMLRNKKQATDRVAQWQAEGIGKFRVIHETPRATTPKHFEQWLKLLDESDTYCQLMVCDYADKMVAVLTMMLV